MIRAVVRSLNRFHVEYAITGAIAASYYGAPRTTIDFDVIAYASTKNVRGITKALQASRIEAEEETFRQATRPGAFNIVRCRDTLSPHTVDVIFRRRKFAKLSGRALGLRTFYHSPEDLVRMKLRMIKATKPPERAIKDFEDIHSILEHSKLSLARIKTHAKADSTSQILDSILSKTS